MWVVRQDECNSEEICPSESLDMLNIIASQNALYNSGRWIRSDPVLDSLAWEYADYSIRWLQCCEEPILNNYKKHLPFIFMFLRNRMRYDTIETRTMQLDTDFV